jgi:hypothetical protein
VYKTSHNSDVRNRRDLILSELQVCQDENGNG